MAPSDSLAPLPAPGPLDLSPRAAAGALLALDPTVGDSVALPPGSGDASGGGLASVTPSFLRRHDDGSFSFEGNGFRARIERSGLLSLTDKNGTFIPMSTRKINDNDWAVNFIDVRFDPFAMLDSAFGNDPYQSERRWFLDETRVSRERMMLRHNTRMVRACLQRIWSAAALDLDARRRRTFAVWNDTSDDEEGVRNRAVVVAFVRERCPRDSASAYTGELLAELNATRHFKEPFAPYAGDEP